MVLRHGSGFIGYFMPIKNCIIEMSCNSINSKTMQIVVPSRQCGKMLSCTNLKQRQNGWRATTNNLDYSDLPASRPTAGGKTPEGQKPN